MQNTREGGGIPGFLDHFGGICMYLQGIQSQRSDDFRGGAGRTRKLLDGLHFPRRVAIWKILVD